MNKKKSKPRFFDIRKFDQVNGGDYIVINDRLLFPTGAIREINPMGKNGILLKILSNVQY